MDERIYRAFAEVRADEALKERTRQAVASACRRRAALPRRVAALAAALALVLGLGGYWAYFVPVSAISLDVNPSIELQLNRFDRVIAAVGRNPEGEALAALVSVTHLPYDQAVKRILESEAAEPYLSRDSYVAITVVGKDPEKSGELLERVSDCTAAHENVHCGASNAREAAQAQAAGLPLGKYQAFLRLRALEPSVQPEDVKDLTMRQIWDWIASLEGGEAPGHGQQGHGGAGHHR